MRMRSTGLGKTELVARIKGMKKEGDYLVIEMRVVEPTNWNIKAGLSVTDIFKIFSQIIKPSNLAYLVINSLKNKDPQSRLEL